MYFNTVAEYDAEIARVETAIKRSLGIGASGSTSVAGNTRQFSEVPFSQLRRYKKELEKERDLLNGKIFMPKSGW